MTGWTKVKWTEARQIAEAMALDPEQLPEAEAEPRAFFTRLRDRGEQELALRYMAQALPRYEAVAWAASRIAAGAEKKLAVTERQALDRSLRWVEEPTDDYRRAAQEAAERARPDSAERLLGQAVFLSGGSIAPPDLPAVIPPHDVCGQLAAAALIIACHRSGSPEQAMRAALDAGDKVAAKGLEALRAA